MILPFQGSLHQVSQRFLEQTLDKKLMSDMRVRYQCIVSNVLNHIIDSKISSHHCAALKSGNNEVILM